MPLWSGGGFGVPGDGVSGLLSDTGSGGGSGDPGGCLLVALVACHYCRLVLVVGLVVLVVGLAVVVVACH